MIKPFHEDARETHDSYRTLIGPAGWTCTLTEPEDRIWSRDLAPAVKRLNEYEAIIDNLMVALEQSLVNAADMGKTLAKTRAELTDLQGRLLNPIRLSATNVRVDIDAPSPVSGPL